jgi:hypothetical protein
MPGHYSPTDFSDLSFEGLKAKIEKGNIAIDWWEGQPRKYYLRARQVGEDIVHGSWGGICVNLAPWGCRLNWDDRPLGCKSLKPHESKYGKCVGSYTKEICKDDWWEHDMVLRKLVAYFGEPGSSLMERMSFLAEAIEVLLRDKEVSDAEESNHRNE